MKGGVNVSQLVKGKISSQELASWFGISYSTYRKKKPVLLESLSEYCSFKEVYGGVEVYDVFISEYVNPKQKNYKEVESHVDEEWDESGLDTKKNVASKIYSKYKNVLTIQPSTTYNYVRKASNKLYGPANDYHTSGTIGNCWYRLCIVDADGNRRPLTKEEQSIREKIKSKYCSKEEQQQREEIEDAIELQYQHGDITKETRDDLRDRLNAWRWAYLQEFESTLSPDESLGYATFKRTFHNEEESAFE